MFASLLLADFRPMNQNKPARMATPKMAPMTIPAIAPPDRPELAGAWVADGEGSTVVVMTGTSGVVGDALVILVGLVEIDVGDCTVAGLLVAD